VDQVLGVIVDVGFFEDVLCDVVELGKINCINVGRDS